MRRHPSAGVWQVVAAEDCPSSRWDLEMLLRAALCCAEGLRALLPFSSRRVGSARWPPCVPGARGTAARVCGRGQCSRHVQGSRGCRGRVCAERWKDSSCSCCRGDQETPPLSWLCEGGRPARHRRPLLRGLSAQKHRSASLVEEEPHPERHRSSTSRRPRRCCPGRDAVSL